MRSCQGRYPLKVYHEFRAGERVVFSVLFGESGWRGLAGVESDTLYFYSIGAVYFFGLEGVERGLVKLLMLCGLQFIFKCCD